MSPWLSDTARTDAHAVAPATNSEPATSHGTAAGRGVALAASITTSSAWLARLSVQPMTSSPTANPSTPSPTCCTTPARSLPSPEGNVAGYRSWSSPCRILASPGLMPAALTLTSSSPAPGAGSSTSTTSQHVDIPVFVKSHRS